MGIFQKLFGGGASVPHWADFFSPSEFKQFMATVEADLHGRRLQYTLEDGVVTIPAATGEPHRCGLQNLAQLCKATPSDEWPKVVQQHFENLFSSDQQRKALEADMHDYEKMRPLLKIRIFPENMPDEVKEAAVCRTLAPGLLAILSIDLPMSTISVSQKDAVKWDIDEDLIFQNALENVRTADPASSEIVNVDEELRLHTIVGDSFFTSTHVMMLGEHLDRPAENGLLVVVPHRHTIIYHYIENKSMVRAIEALLQMAYGMYKEGPGSISPALYWWRDGDLTILPSEVDDKSISFHPPGEFLETLSRVCG